MKKILSFTISFIILLSSLSVLPMISASAENATLFFSSSLVNVGENVSASLKFTVPAGGYKLEGTVQFDDKILQYISGATSSEASKLNISIESEGSSKAEQKSVSVVFKAIAPGQSLISFNLKLTPNGAASKNVGASATLKTKGDAIAPDSSGLSALSVDKGTLSPAFSDSIYEYSVNLSETDKEITFEATPADSSAVVSGAGKQKLNSKNNRFYITVKTVNSKKTYTVNVVLSSNDADSDADKSGSNVLDVTVNSQKYHIIPELSNVMIPATLTPETINYKDMDVTVVTDPKNKYEIYYLSSDDNKISDWFYVDGLGDFHRLNYVISNNMIYIIEDELQEPFAENIWTLSKLKLETGTVKAYRSTDSRLNGIYILYCYVNGENGYYRYDTSDNTIQRAPDFVLAGNSSTKQSSSNIVNKFSSISKAGKLIIFLSFFEFLSIICLIISIINMKKSKKFDIQFEQEEDYKENHGNYQE